MKVTQELKDTVAANDHIKEVHFTADGHHHFNVHEHEKKKYVQVFRDTVVNKEGKRVERVVPNLKTNIVETMSAEEIAKANVPAASKEEGEASNKKK